MGTDTGEAGTNSEDENNDAAVLAQAQVRQEFTHLLPPCFPFYFYFCFIVLYLFISGESILCLCSYSISQLELKVLWLHVILSEGCSSREVIGLCVCLSEDC